MMFMMTITAAQIDQWRIVPTETQGLEFKEAKTKHDWIETLHYCVGIANEGGGHLIFGVSDKLPRKVVGTSAHPDVIKCADELFQTLHFRVDLCEVAHPDGRVLVFCIPGRPRGTAYEYKGTYFMRTGASLRGMTPETLRTIFAEGDPLWLDEISEGGLEPEHVIDLLDTQAYFDLLKRPFPTTRESVIKHLLDERLVEVKDGFLAIKRVTAIMLAKRLLAFGDVARKAPRVVVYSGNNKLETRIDQVGAKGYAAGFQDLVRFIMAQLPQNEVIKDALRSNVTMISEGAVRELVANALIHQDFTISGAGPMIEIYKNRMEVSNPGQPLVPVERFIDGYQSRNEYLTDLMRRMKICEERSSGVDRVVSTAEAYQLPAPEFRSDLGRTTVVVHGIRSFEDMTRDDRIRACYQHCVLKWVMSERVTNETLRERFGLPQSRASVASQIIAATIEAGMIKADESVGASKKYARYLPHWA
jgi:ATP-dependent DNA helicase RecG